MISFRKKKPLNISKEKIGFVAGAPYSLYAGLCDHFSGEKYDGELFGKAGASAQADVVLLRTYKTEPFVVAVNIGGQWFAVAKIEPGDPLVEQYMKDGTIKVYEESPHLLEARRKLEQEKKENEDAAQRRMDERSAHYRQRKEQEEAKRQKQLERMRA